MKEKVIKGYIHKDFTLKRLFIWVDDLDYSPSIDTLYNMHTMRRKKSVKSGFTKRIEITIREVK